MKKIILVLVLLINVIIISSFQFKVNAILTVVNYDESDYVINDVGQNDSYVNSMYLFSDAPRSATITGYINKYDDKDYYSFVINEYTNITLNSTYDYTKIFVDLSIVYYERNKGDGLYDRVEVSNNELQNGYILSPGVYAIEVSGQIIDGDVDLNCYYFIQMNTENVLLSTIDQSVSLQELKEKNVPYISWTNQSFQDGMMVNISADYQQGLIVGSILDSQEILNFDSNNTYQNLYILDPHYGMALGILLRELATVYRDNYLEIENISNTDDIILFTIATMVGLIPGVGIAATLTTALILEAVGYIINEIQINNNYIEYKYILNNYFTTTEATDEFASFFNEFGIISLIQSLIDSEAYGNPIVFADEIRDLGGTIYTACSDQDDDVVKVSIDQTNTVKSDSMYDYIDSIYSFGLFSVSEIPSNDISEFNNVVGNEYGKLYYPIRMKEYQVSSTTVEGYTWQQSSAGFGYFSSVKNSYFSLYDTEGSSKVMYTYQPTVKTEYYHKYIEYKKYDKVTFNIYKKKTILGVIPKDELIGTKTYYMDDAPEDTDDIYDFDNTRYYTSSSYTNYSFTDLTYYFYYSSYFVYLRSRSNVSNDNYFVKTIDVDKDYTKKRTDETAYSWDSLPTTKDDYSYTTYITTSTYVDGYGSTITSNIRYVSYYRKYYKVFTYVTTTEYIWDYDIPSEYTNPIETGEVTYEDVEISYN